MIGVISVDTDQPVRILHVVQSLDTGGLENGVINLANNINQDRFHVDIACLRYIGKLRDRLRAGVEVYFDSGTGSIRGATCAIRELVRQHCYDIVHTHGWATLLPGFVGTRFLPAVSVINGEHGTFFVDSWRRRISQRALFRWVDANVTVSAALRREMHTMFGVDPASVTPIINGVDIDTFYSTPERRAAARDLLEIQSESIVFGTVGRLVPVKDYGTLIRAFKELADAVPSAVLVLVGDGPELGALQQIAGGLLREQRILFAGNRDDVPALMPAFDVFCLTSLREGLSNTLLEAHASGVPTLATDTGGNGEVVEHDTTGFLFEVGDSHALAKHMRRLAENADLRREFGAAARDRAVSRFSIASMVHSYEQEYMRVAKR